MTRRLDALAAALDCRDHETEGPLPPGFRIFCPACPAGWAYARARYKFCGRGALIHDIGKIGVPDSVLHKNGPLTGSEWEVMQKHPQAGWEMLQNIPYLHEEVQLGANPSGAMGRHGLPLGLGRVRRFP